MVVQQGHQDLVIFALGPVQSFIATARRTQDLWVGSQLLSNLALAGVRAASRPNTKFLFPIPVNGKWPASIPNRFAFLVSSGQGKALGWDTANAVEGEWLSAAKKVGNFFASLVLEGGWQEAWERQVNSWLETYWVAWPWDGRDYGSAYRRAGLAMDARKQIRPYPERPEPGEKCTLCGVRQALHGRREERREVTRFWTRIAQHSQVTGAELRADERLCAICTIKRFAARAGVKVAGRALKPEDRFPSTSSVAATTFKALVLKKWNELESLVLKHLDALDALNAQSGAPFVSLEPFEFLIERAKGKPNAERLLHYDGDFFYRETFSAERLDDVLGRGPVDHDRNQATRALGTLNALLREAGRQGIAPPNSYLAVLALDGDWMGQLLSGCQNPEEHRAISRALVSFAEVDAPRIIQHDHAGRLVYAGGDDVLALLPVDDALSAANELRRALSDGLKIAGWSDRTASAGVAISHHIQPLESALRAARRAERAAKDDLSRNALMVDVLRRSGERTRVGLNWLYKDGPEKVLGLLVRMKDLMVEGTLSGKLAYDLRGEAAALRSVPTAHKAELARLLCRHWGSPLTEAKKALIRAYAEELAALSQDGRVGIEKLADWLLLVRFLAQGGRE